MLIPSPRPISCDDRGGEEVCLSAPAPAAWAEETRSFNGQQAVANMSGVSIKLQGQVIRHGGRSYPSLVGCLSWTS